MLTINNLKPGIIILYNNQPHEVVESHFQKRANEEEVAQTKLKNLITGASLNQNFKDASKFEEANVSRETCRFIYSNQGQYWFHKAEKPSARFFLEESQIGESRLFLKPNTLVDILFFEEKPISVSLPIKIELRVIEAPPGFRGNTSQAGTKEVILETRAKIKTPLFIEEGDIIRVNTRTGEYVERVQKH